MKKIFTIALVLLAALPVRAAGRLDLKDITAGHFRPQAMAAVKALDAASYTQIAAEGRQIVKCDFRTGRQTAVLFDAQTARGATIDRVDGYIVSPDQRRILIQTDTKPIYRRSFTATYYIYTVANNRLEPLSQGGPQQAPVWSPDGEQVAFVREGNIYLVKLLYNNAESQVTTDGQRNRVINGVPDWVCEEEFSFNSALTFTADSRQLVWVRYDESLVPERYLPLAPAGWQAGAQRADGAWQQPADTYTYKYPRAGEQNARQTLLSYDIKSHQTRTLQLPLDADGYIPRIKATADPARIAVYTLNRHQDNLRIYMANPLSTVCQLVVSDQVDRYISEDVFANTYVTPAHIVLTSERSGYNTAYVYNLNGQLQRTIPATVDQPSKQNTPLSNRRGAGGEASLVTAVYGYDEPTGDLYYAAVSPTAPTDQRIYVAHRNGKTDCLTPAAGWHTALFATDMRTFVCTWSDINHPPVVTLRSSQGKTLATLVDNQPLADRYATYDMGPKELFTLTTADGVQLNGWMVKPHGFDPRRQYPVVMYQYGGPGSQQVHNAWDIGMSGQGAIIEQYLAQQGYIAVCVDNRGTGGRGADFEKCTYLRLGQLEAHDQVETALWLAQQPYVDPARIAIWGWSYGGWNTLMAMSEGRPVFRCGVAIAPPTCWRYYDTVYTERFMRTPQENADGYDNVCPIAWAPRLSGALLLVHGLADDNVHYQNTADYVSALVEADKDFRQLVYTNRNHSIYGGNTRNHLFRQCINFFNENMNINQ